MSYFLAKSLVVLLVVLELKSKSTDAGVMANEVKDLCHRLNYLKIIYNIKNTASAPSEEVAESEDASVRETLMFMHHLHLEDKLQEL